MAELDSTAQNSPFLRNLASSDPSTRASALENLRLYLSGHSAFSPLDLLKLWKGLFYSMWMSDKPKYQQRLARDLAGLVEVLRAENKVPFLDSFWKTMAREWGGIDVLRMDKFLYLVRLFVAIGFKEFVNGGGDGYLEVLEETPLDAKDMKIPNGLRYHVLDIYVDELEKADPDKKLAEGKRLREVLEPVEAIARTSPTKSVRKRAKETLDDKRLKSWSGSTIEDAGAEDVEGDASDTPMETTADKADDGDGDWDGIDD